MGMLKIQPRNSVIKIDPKIPISEMMDFIKANAPITEVLLSEPKLVSENYLKTIVNLINEYSKETKGS